MNPRHLPPLNALRAFEAAARHGNFSRAAEELCVTQGAVSRQIAKLESHLGAALFRRGGRRLELTFEGARFYGFVHGAFERVLDGMEIFSQQGRGLTYQAAIDRPGVVVAQRASTQDDLATGRLVAPFPLVVPGERAYYLVYPPNRLKQTKVTLFRDWLLEAVGAQNRNGSPPDLYSPAP